MLKATPLASIVTPYTTFMRLGLAQINTTVGDLAGNRRRILDAYAKLVDGGAELVVFPELVVCGYPPRDLLFKRHFVPDVEESMRAAGRGRRAMCRPSSGRSRRTRPGRGAPSTTRPPSATAGRSSQSPTSACCRPTTCSTRTGTLSRQPGADGRRPRRRAHWRHDLRGHLDAPDDQHPPPLQRPRPGEAAGRPEVRRHGESVGQPLALWQVPASARRW